MQSFLGLHFGSGGLYQKISLSYFGGSSEHKEEDDAPLRDQLLRTVCETFWPLHIPNIRVTEKEDKPTVNAHSFIFLAYLC